MPELTQDEAWERFRIAQEELNRLIKEAKERKNENKHGN